jgi:hypothetical protein
MRLTYVRLLVDDYGGAFRFWRDAARLEPTFGDEQSGYADYVVPTGGSGSPTCATRPATCWS